MSYKRWTTSRHSVFHLGYHLIWCPKYRRPVLVDGVDERLKELLLEKADDIGITIENMEILPNHVHLFVRSDPTNAPHSIVGQLKGYSSCVLRREFPWLKKRIPTLWTRSYFIHSVGCISEDIVKKYIEDQKGI